ncbi:MAG: tandem-95 repeat protein, partial [Xanthomonadales bacterium]|nr:tandem-95 repeat protein [Xanthomonadales bacterium]
MAYRFAGTLFLLLCFFLSTAQAQNRFYHVYFDTDNSATTGCSVNLPDFATSITGVDRRLTITTDSALPPTITATQLHQCAGGVFDSGNGVSMAALGLNTGINGADVFEASVSQTQLGINRSGAVLLYFHTQSDNASDIVLGNGNGDPIVLGFTFPVPALGLITLCLLLVLLLFTSRKQLSKRITVSMVCICLVSSVWAMNIIIDGQTNDWNTIAPDSIDPVGDTSNSGSYADLTAVFVTKSNETIFVRMDVVDVENQAPVANINSDATLEDTSVTITLTGSDAEGSPVTFSTDTAPANGALSNFSVINNTTSTVLYTPNADFNGTDNFTVVANDGQVNSAPANVEVNVTAVNDAPSFTSGGNVNVLKTAGPYSASWATNVVAGPSDETSQNLTFNIINNDNTGIFDVLPVIDSSGVLSFTGTPDVSGTANITVNLSDDGGTANGGIDTSANVTFAIILQSVNDEPSFTVGSNQSVLEDAGAITVPSWATNVLAGPPDEVGQTLTFNIIANDNPGLFSAGPAVASDGTLSYTTAADANGVANISIELMDDGGTANGGDDTSPPQNFSITVTAINDAPSFTAGPGQSLLEGAGAQTVNGWATAIAAGPADEAGQSLSFNVSNDNNALFDVQPNISSTGTLTFTPNAAALGSATVSVSLSDDGGTANGGIDTSAVQNFIISITAVNDEPSFTVGADQTINEDNGPITVAAWATNILAGPPDEAGQNLTFNITANDNAPLFSAGPAVAADGTLTYTPAADANGVANITLELMDDGGTANGGDDTSPPQSFMITVTAVNDAPSFTVGGDQSVLEESSAQSVNGWATAIFAGPADESGQTVSFNVTNNNNALFSVQPAVDNSGNLTYTPAANTSGTAIVSVTAADDGGTANGGVDTSAIQNFNITITAVNDAPSFTAGATPQTADEDSGAQNIAWATAISAGPPDENGQNLTFILNQTNIDSTLSFTAVPSISATGILSYTAAANAYGSVSYNVSLMDDGGTANGGIDTSPSVPLTITINPINDPPAAGALGPYTATTNISVSYA